MDWSALVLRSHDEAVSGGTLEDRGGLAYDVDRRPSPWVVYVAPVDYLSVGIATHLYQCSSVLHPA